MQIIDPDDELSKVVEVQKSLPPTGYIPIELSTKGKLGVPKKIHVRNFKTAEMIDISLFSGDILSEKIISVLNDLIYEDVNVGDWPDKCVLELLITVYVNFFTPTIPGVIFPWDESDLEYLKTKGMEDKIETLKSGKWKPETDISLTKIKINPIPDNVRSQATVSKKDKEGNIIIKAKFLSYPRYGDSLTIKKLMDGKFEESDKQYSDIRGQVEVRERMIERGDVHIPEIDNKKYIEWKTYEVNKAIFVAKATQAMYLTHFNGKDLKSASISEKIKIMDDPLFDMNIANAIEKSYSTLNFGIDPEIEVMNPITGKPCKRRFSFRIMDVLQALRSSDVDGYDICYDEENE